MRYKERAMTFTLPRYEEIPNIGLYLNQVVTYINNCLMPFEDLLITESMVSNYVKKKLIENPKRKQYSRSQIAYLLFIALSKSVLSMTQIQKLFSMQKKSYKASKIYDRFCDEFEAALKLLYGEGSEPHPSERSLLTDIVLTSVHKIYLDDCIQSNRQH